MLHQGRPLHPQHWISEEEEVAICPMGADHAPQQRQQPRQDNNNDVWTTKLVEAAAVEDDG